MDDYDRSCFYNRAGNSSCHREQYITAKQIAGEYIRSRRQVLLAAQMQSGKTGVYLSLAIMMVMTNAVNRVFIICGSNDVKLHAQLVGGVIDGVATEGDIKTAIDRCVAMAPANKEEVAARLALAIKAYKSSDLRKASTAPITSDTLVIWDESHFAQNRRNWPARFLGRCGLSVGGTERSDAKWTEKRSFFLSVSATPFAEFSAKHGREKERVTRSIVIHEPGDAYIGAMDFTEARAIEPAFRVEGRKEDFTALLARHAAATPNKYALIRSRNLDVVKECCRVAGVAYKNYYNGALELAGGDIKKALKTAPDRFTVVGLKELCRMGEVIPKEHIAFVFEEAKESKTDTLLQSLLGRMCGYSASPEQKAAFLAQIKIYVPDCFTAVKETDEHDVSELVRYLRFTTEGIITPLKATCMGPKPKRSGKLILQPRWVPFDFGEDEDPAPARGARAARAAVGGAGAADVEDDSDDSDYVDSGDDVSDSEDEAAGRPRLTANRDRRVAMCAAALAALRVQPYEDMDQRADAMRNMTADNCEFHDLQSNTYKYVQGVAGDKKTPGIYDHLQKNMRWDDHWNDGKAFKFYMVKRGDEFNNHSYDQDGFYIVGYTADGNDETKRECYNHIIPINSTCAFHPDADLADDEVIHAFPMHVVRNDRDADDFFAQPAGSQRFYYVSNDYAKTPRGRVIYGLLAAASAHAGKTKTGPKLTAKKKAEMGIPAGEKFERFVMVPGISYSIAVHGNADGTTINIKINDGEGNQISDMNLAFPVGTPFSLDVSMHGRPTLSLTA
jgi:hypothetical protein